MLNQKISGSSKDNFGDIIPHIVQTACSFRSVITFKADDKSVNAKSIMGVMALAGTDISQIEVKVEGDDEEAAMSAIKELLQ